VNNDVGGGAIDRAESVWSGDLESHAGRAPTPEAWVRVAYGRRVHPDVIGFLRERPGWLLGVANDRHRHAPFRVWESVAFELLPEAHRDDVSRDAAILALLDREEGAAFLEYRRLMARLTPVAHLLTGRAPMRVPGAASARRGVLVRAASTLWTLGGRTDAIWALLDLAELVSAEEAAVLLVDTLNAGSSPQVERLVRHPGFRRWARRNWDVFVTRAVSHTTHGARRSIERALPDALPLLAGL
jgi:hypothetical protein